jgi:predicted DNA-binding transcriptional regulator YafY
MLRRLERVLKLDGILRSHTRPTALVLAGELEVSERTVRDDIAFLKDRINE